MKNSLYAIVVVTLFTMVFAPESQSTEPQDLLSLYYLAKAKDPVLGVYSARLEGKQAEVSSATAALLPRLDGNISGTRYFAQTLHYTPSAMSSNYNGYGYGFGVTQPLFNLPAIIARRDVKAGTRSAEAAIEATRQDLMGRLAEAYFNVLKNRCSERLFGDEVKRYQRLLDQANAFLKAGTGDVIAVYEAQARLDNARAELIKTQSQRSLSERQLEILTGVSLGPLRDVEKVVPEGPVPNELAHWLEQTKTKQPLIIQAREELAVASSQVSQVKAEHMPTINLTGGYNVSKGSTFLPEVETKQWYMGVGLSMALFRGGDVAARTRRAKAAETERNFQLQDTVNQSVKKTEEAFLNLKYNVSMVNSLELKKSSTAVQLKATEKGRAIGTRSSIDLLNAEQSHAASIRDLSGARYDNMLYRLKLKIAAGEASEEDLASLNSLLTATTSEGVK